MIKLQTQKATKMLFSKYYFFLAAALAIQLNVSAQGALSPKDSIKLQCLNALAGANKAEMENSISRLKDLSKTDSLAYAGALLMKMASVIQIPIEKLNSFKTGKEYLETSIETAPTNVEYRMLRALIQENAPGFLKYNQNLEEDVAMVMKNRNQLSPAIRAKVNKIPLFNPSDKVD